MKIINLWKSAVAMAVLGLVVVPIPAKAGTMADGRASLPEWSGRPETSGPEHEQECRNRPLDDFLKAQGKLNNPPQFFPPVRDYVGWVDAVNPATKLPTTFALVDYAGLADKYIQKRTGGSLGTKLNGSIVECKQASGKTQVSVALFALNALAFAQSISDLAANNFDFNSTPPIFGTKAKAANATNAAVGSAILLTTFSIAKPGANLPDFLDVVNNPVYAPVSLSFAATATGKCADGRNARLDVHQAASTDDHGALAFFFEYVKAADVRGGTCTR